ncbi:MAG: MBL fold metallo-hydrolase [Clostridia bacterium]|nr:MBL fold metallo-hydrolase [Clostridia bacterium]
MKKILQIIVFIILIVIPIGILKCDDYRSEQGKTIVEVPETEGMRITLIGGSNTKDNGNTNSMGYFIRTKNGVLIAVDGGRNIDAQTLKSYIDKYGNGKVDYWFVTHAHGDHIGGLVELLKTENITIDNLYYSLCTREWYITNDERGRDAEISFLDSLSNPKIKNQFNCTKGQKIDIDNLTCEIIRVANPAITDSDNGNEMSMTFKFTANDVDKSMLFLGDSYNRASEELVLEKDKLGSYAVQMAHHGQNGVTEEVYNYIHPTVCFYNAPLWLFNNDIGNGYNTAQFKSVEVQKWMEKFNPIQYKAYEGDVTVQLYSGGQRVVDN